MFGKNLKKIRSIHGLSQQDFADLFDLKRGTLGAYEEGRSNPKLETVIKIANNFSIGIEELLIKELTVNRLLKFNESITTESDSHKDIDFVGIPCILPKDKILFAKNYDSKFDFSRTAQIRLPFVETVNRIAFSVDDLSMTGDLREFFPKDIVIGIACEIAAIADKCLVIAIVDDELVFRKLHLDENTCLLKADHHGVADIIVTRDELKYVWKIEHVFQFGINTKEIILENRLNAIEQNIASLKKKKTT
ncbi:helix-turn-helix domain-containing protein [Flavobacterium sp. SM2513]|uniref:helix-turn-helix domain-containing protein n=1 Tax=Flavobacterium sp. SM2513 TaxID=3424766 RepID=UPI003D7F44B5